VSRVTPSPAAVDFPRALAHFFSFSDILCSALSAYFEVVMLKIFEVYGLNFFIFLTVFILAARTPSVTARASHVTVIVLSSCDARTIGIRPYGDRAVPLQAPHGLRTRGLRAACSQAPYDINPGISYGRRTASPDM